jgi:hypothetical protein
MGFGDQENGDLLLGQNEVHSAHRHPQRIRPAFDADGWSELVDSVKPSFEGRTTYEVCIQAAHM